ncbi:MAG: hypothetical protein ABFD29_11620 [Anaerolineaceae bacterium]
MDKEIDSEIKIILGNVSELAEREDELTQNRDFLAMYSFDWTSTLFRVTKIWNLIREEEKKIISDMYDHVKPIAMKLKLPWPEELSN